MRKINLTTYLFMVCLLLGNIQFSNAQLLKKLKDTATGKTESSSSSNSSSSGKGSSKMIGESEINDEFKVDEYGFNGIYYSQTKRGIIKAKFEFEICKDKSTAKGAEDMPGCLKLKYEIPEDNSTIWRNTDAVDGYAYPQSAITTKNMYFPKRGMFGDLFQIAEGVFLMTPNNASSSFTGSDANALKDDYDFKYIVESGSFFVKNKEELSKWTATPEIIELVKTKIQEALRSVQSIYAEVEGKKNAKNEMPSIGKLNTKFIQDRALKTYKEKYEPINKGWTHDYMYVHGNEWVNKKKYLPNGQLVESHRELHVVIVRKNPQGQCKADLMYYVEIFENGKYDAANGKVTGPVSYVDMPGGYLPCEKAAAFKSKLAK